jgi:hypothetical protein
VTDTGTYETAAAAGAGFMSAHVADNLLDRLAPMDVSDEVTGILVMGLAAAYGGDYSAALMAGAGVYTADAAARRFGIKNTVTSLRPEMSRSIYARQGTSSEIVSTQTNATGVFTPILTVDPSDGTLIELLNRVATEAEQGITFFAQFNDGSDNCLPGNSSFRFVLELVGECPAVAVPRLTVAVESHLVDVIEVLEGED